VNAFHFLPFFSEKGFGKQEGTTPEQGVHKFQKYLFTL
jgi:hypothetical protein